MKSYDQIFLKEGSQEPLVQGMMVPCVCLSKRMGIDSFFFLMYQKCCMRRLKNSMFYSHFCLEFLSSKVAKLLLSWFIFVLENFL